MILPISQIRKYYVGVYEKYLKILDDLDYHLLIAGQTGSGKDTFAFTCIALDRHLGRNVIIFDPKGEYVGLIFPNIKPKFQEYMEFLQEGHNVTVWVPCTIRTPDNPEFKQLMKFGEIHPNLSVRPFRLRFVDIRNQDATSFALGFSQLQAMSILGKTEAGAMSEYYKKRRIETGESALFIDFEEKELSGNIEYLNFDDVFKNPGVHVFVYKFLLDESTQATTASMSALLAEVMSRITTLNIPTRIVISELAILTPQEAGSKMLEASSGLRTKIGQLMRFARSGGGRMMLVSQQITDYSDATASQAKEVFVGRIRGKELMKLQELFSLDYANTLKISSLSVGDFAMMHKGIIKHFPSPPSYKPDERETMVSMIKSWYADPVKFCVQKFSFKYSDLPIVDRHMTEREFLERFKKYTMEHPGLPHPQIHVQEERHLRVLEEQAKPIWNHIKIYKGEDVEYQYASGEVNIIRPSVNDIILILLTEYLAQQKVDRNKANYSGVERFLNKEGIVTAKLRNRNKHFRPYEVKYIFPHLVTENEREFIFDSVSENLPLILDILRKEQMDYIDAKPPPPPKSRDSEERTYFKPKNKTKKAKEPKTREEEIEAGFDVMDELLSAPPA